MTYFETPDEKAAYVAGMTLRAWEAQQEALEIEAEMLADLGDPHLDPEDRRYVDEGDVALVTEQDREDLQVVLDWEAFGGFHNP